MVKKMSIFALELSDLIAATPGLEWSKPTQGQSGHPTTRGVYAWLDMKGRVLYIGKAAGENGLRSRLGLHRTERTKADLQSVREKRRFHKGVLAGLSEHKAVVCYAPAEDPAHVEAVLLAFSVLLTGYRPPLNGQGWDWNDASKAIAAEAEHIFDHLGLVEHSVK